MPVREERRERESLELLSGSNTLALPGGSCTKLHKPSIVECVRNMPVKKLRSVLSIAVVRYNCKKHNARIQNQSRVRE